MADTALRYAERRHSLTISLVRIKHVGSAGGLGWEAGDLADLMVKVAPSFSSIGTVVLTAWTVVGGAGGLGREMPTS
jgi:hypothetical protein